MTETAEIRTVWEDEIVTAELVNLWPPRTLIGVKRTSEATGSQSFVLAPDEAVKLAHRLLTLAHEAGAEISE
jgi:hypothetical protein